MLNKLINVAVVALVSMTVSFGVSAHVENGAVVDGSGHAVVSNDGKCVRTNDGSYVESCEPKTAVAPEPKKVRPIVKPVAKKKPVRNKVTMSGDTLFATDSANITTKGRSILNDFVSRTQGVTITGIKVEGHADSTGAEQYNQALSERRARSVKSYLVSKGVYPAVISTRGFGESRPVASNKTAVGRAKNRRVEVTVTGLK